MKAAGYEIKRGKYISFRAPGQERFTRSKTLGEAYTVEAITERIAGTYRAKPKALRQEKVGEDTQLEAGGKDFEFPNGA